MHVLIDPNKLLLLGKKVDLEVRKSPIAGWGLYTNNFIIKDELIYVDHHLIHDDGLSDYLNDRGWLISTSRGDLLLSYPFVFLNHSNRPNCSLTIGSDHSVLKILRSIKCDSELVINYGRMYE